MSSYYWKDIEAFQMLYRAEVTPEQARALLQVAEEAAQRRAVDRQISTDPDVLAAMREMRALAAAGKPITDEAWERLNVARQMVAQRLGAPAESDPWDKAAAAVRAILPLFTDQQKLALGDLGYWLMAEALFDGLSELRAAPAEQWQEWRADTEGLVPGQLSAANRAGVLALLDEARGLTPDEFWARRDDVERRLKALYVPDLTPAERDERCAGELASRIVEHRGFHGVLQEYLDAASRRPTAPGAEP